MYMLALCAGKSSLMCRILPTWQRYGPSLSPTCAPCWTREHPCAELLQIVALTASVVVAPFKGTEIEPRFSLTLSSEIGTATVVVPLVAVTWSA